MGWLFFIIELTSLVPRKCCLCAVWYVWMRYRLPKPLSFLKPYTKSVIRQRKDVENSLPVHALRFVCYWHCSLPMAGILYSRPSLLKRRIFHGCEVERYRGGDHPRLDWCVIQQRARYTGALSAIALCFPDEGRVVCKHRPDDS